MAKNLETVTNLNKDVTKDLLDKIKKTNSSEESTPKEIHLELNSTKGKIQFAIEIINTVQESTIDLIINCRGKLSAAGTILAAGGKPGFRTAKFGTQFFLGKRKLKNGEIENPQIEQLKDILLLLAKNKKLTKQFLENKNLITDCEAKQCGIIDSTGFINKYKKQNSMQKK